MVEYEIAQLIRLGSPVLGGVLCMIIGMLIVNTAWRRKIHRYAKAEIISTLEQQDNRIKQYKIDLGNANDKIGTLQGIIKSSKKHALKIIGSIELEKGEL